MTTNIAEMYQQHLRARQTHMVKIFCLYWCPNIDEKKNRKRETVSWSNLLLVTELNTWYTAIKTCAGLNSKQILLEYPRFEVLRTSDWAQAGYNFPLVMVRQMEQADRDNSLRLIS